ncbi:hypothetical protein FA95DRAFT_1680455 [Auriscalpium vulgare]|uniref:Uncharacterized protein n=1 Tax=Auriscalpium vulgare TaxID=40419 RepID=A0ACB8RP34_9AGAM|nr:hypothetical protein FA95DRAFT_1680455 [Auriscalpium vulgare]
MDRDQPSSYWWTLELDDSTKVVVSSTTSWNSISKIAPNGVTVKQCAVAGEVQLYVAKTLLDPESWALMNQTVRNAYVANIYHDEFVGDRTPPIMLGSLSCRHKEQQK